MQGVDTASALLNVQQMGEADRLAVVGGTSALTLMENAGSQVAREIARRWSRRPIGILCGPGNNGGDGFVAARHLADAGWPVRVALLGTPDQLKGEARANADRWPGPIERLTEAVLENAELVIDALFGAGLDRPLESNVTSMLAAVSALGVPIVAIDVPSGLMGDTGVAVGAVTTTLTVTFFRKKPGHLLLPGRELCGIVVVTDIGTPEAVLDVIRPDTFENTPACWRASLPQIQNDANKYGRGHALVWGGYPATGAARMAARGAARAGAGLTTIAVAPVALPVYAAALTSIMVHPIAMPDDMRVLIRDVRITAMLVGPGAGVTEQTRDVALVMLATGRPVVLDADALTIFRHQRELLSDAITGPCVLTPHDGEFARLFDDQGDRLRRARAASKRSGAIVILKGRDTVIAAPDGRAVINSNAPPSLATGGSGDVLSGIVLGLLAQGMPAFAAASAGVWLHGAAAVHFGPGLIAEDLPDCLPAVFASLQVDGIIVA
ncbi:bifunctional ADP-dependent NAD(P)H-hydrate dehydratase/NAD(P)H-hydrate epimerase [soil metagenome]